MQAGTIVIGVYEDDMKARIAALNEDDLMARIAASEKIIMMPKGKLPATETKKVMEMPPTACDAERMRAIALQKRNEKSDAAKMLADSCIKH